MERISINRQHRQTQNKGFDTYIYIHWSSPGIIVMQQIQDSLLYEMRTEAIEKIKTHFCIKYTNLDTFFLF